MLKSNKVIVLVIILITIGIIWYAKSSQNGKQDIADKSDFALFIDKIDMDNLKSFNLPILLDFGSDSCAPCKEMAPALVKVNAKFKDKALVKFIDIWKYKDEAQGYPVKLIPTQLLISKSGKPYKPNGKEPVQLDLHYDESNNHIFTTHLGMLNEKQMTDLINLMEVQ